MKILHDITNRRLPLTVTLGHELILLAIQGVDDQADFVGKLINEVLKGPDICRSAPLSASFEGSGATAYQHS